MLNHPAIKHSRTSTQRKCHSVHRPNDNKDILIAHKLSTDDSVIQIQKTAQAFSIVNVVQWAKGDRVGL